MRILSLVLLLLTVPVYLADAAEPPSETERHIRELMVASRVDDFVVQIQDQIQSGIETGWRDGENMPRKELAILTDIMVKAFNPDSIRRDIVAHFKKYYDRARFAAILKQLRTPLAIRMTDLEVQSGTSAAYQEMLHYAASLTDNPPEPARIHLMNELDAVSHASEVLLSLQLEITKNMLQASAAYDSKQPPLNPQQLNNILNAMSDQMMKGVRQITLITHLFIYRTVSDKELGDYIRFYRNGDLQWYLGLYSTAFIKAMGNASMEAGKRIAEHHDNRGQRPL